MAHRIGIDVTSAVTQGGGIGRYTRELIQALVNQSADNEFCFFSAKPPVKLPIPNPIPQAENTHYRWAPVDERWLYRLWYRLRLPLPVQLVMGRLDLFHSPDFVLPPVYGRIPTLLTVHDLSFVHFPDTFPTNLVAYLNRVVPWSVRRATHILADSESTRQDLMNVWQVPAAKITVLYSGVNETFRPNEDTQKLTAVRERYQLGHEPYLLSVGTVQPRKNYQMLIRAFRAIAEKWPHNLVIAGGQGWLYNDLMAEVSRQGLDDRVRFIGFVADDDLPVLYSAADLFLFPSIYEGFGLPLLEAMGCGAPVITANKSSLPEVAGKAALKLSPHKQADWTEAMDTLLGDVERRINLTRSGYEQIKKFSWQRAAGQLLAIYEALLS